MSTRYHLEAIVPVPSDADGGDGVEVYWDDFDGSVDFTTPISPHPVPLFPQGDIRQRGWGHHPWCLGGGLEGYARRPLQGWGVQQWGADPWCDPQPYAAVAFKHPRGTGGYGTARFGFLVIGPTGNSVGSAVETDYFISPADAVPLASQTLDGYSPGTDTATFSWVRQVED